MGRIPRFLKGFLKLLGDAKGVSLYETTAAIAMTAVVAAVAIPMAIERIEDAKLTRAANEVLNINGAMQKFFEHTGRWPGEAEIRRAGSARCFLQTGLPTSDPTAGTLLPGLPSPHSLGTTLQPFDAGEVLGRPCDTITPFNVLNINDFLVRKPSVVDYPNWDGPYMEPLPSDPWDRAYIINVLPLIFETEIPDPGIGRFTEAVGPLGYAWITTGGPDRLLETPLTAAQLRPGSDDTGKNLGARTRSSAGPLLGQ